MKKRILIIEDEKEIARILELRLKMAGYDVFKAYDGQEGLEKVKSSAPDLILLDLVLPKMGGRQVFLELKKDKDNKNIPVIIVTGLSKEACDKKFPIIGADAYFMKPFDFIELLAAIEDLLGNSGRAGARPS